MASSPRTRQSLSGTEADSLLCGIPVRTATAILSLLLLAGCGPYRHGFKIADPATQCKDCYHSLYFLSPESDPGPALELALNGDYAAAESSLASGAGADASEAGEAVTEKRDQGDCLLLNNRGLLRLLQGDSRKALEYLWKAHTLCPTNETIEGNLKILLSRTPGP